MTATEMSVEERLLFRIGVAIRTVGALRQAIESNGNLYSGSLYPNLTTLTDVLHTPFEEMERQVRDFPQYDPRLHDPDLEELRRVVIDGEDPFYGKRKG